MTPLPALRLPESTGTPLPLGGDAVMPALAGRFAGQLAQALALPDAAHSGAEMAHAVALDVKPGGMVGGMATATPMAGDAAQAAPLPGVVMPGAVLPNAVLPGAVLPGAIPRDGAPVDQMQAEMTPPIAAQAGDAISPQDHATSVVVGPAEEGTDEAPADEAADVAAPQGEAGAEADRPVPVAATAPDLVADLAPVQIPVQIPVQVPGVALSGAEPARPLPGKGDGGAEARLPARPAARPGSGAMRTDAARSAGDSSLSPARATGQPALPSPAALPDQPAMQAGASVAPVAAASLPAAPMPAAPLPATPSLPAPIATAQPDWPARVATASIAALTPDGGTMILDLAPEDLGRLRVTLTIEGDTATVRFQTETPEAARLLSDAERQLSAEFARGGVTLTGHSAQSDRQNGAPSGQSGQAPGSGRNAPDDASDTLSDTALPPARGVINLIA